jgi:hypothetical protein
LGFDDVGVLVIDGDNHIGQGLVEGGVYGFGGGVGDGAVRGVMGTEEAVDEGDDCPGGKFHEEFEDPVEEGEGVALVQGYTCLWKGISL